MPIVTLSKSMSSAAFGACAGGATLGWATGAMGATAEGPRWNGATVRVGADALDRDGLRLMKD